MTDIAGGSADKDQSAVQHEIAKNLCGGCHSTRLPDRSKLAIIQYNTAYCLPHSGITYQYEAKKRAIPQHQQPSQWRPAEPPDEAAKRLGMLSGCLASWHGRWTW